VTVDSVWPDGGIADDLEGHSSPILQICIAFRMVLADTARCAVRRRQLSSLSHESCSLHSADRSSNGVKLLVRPVTTHGATSL